MDFIFYSSDKIFGCTIDMEAARVGQEPTQINPEQSE